MNLLPPPTITCGSTGSSTALRILTSGSILTPTGALLSSSSGICLPASSGISVQSSGFGTLKSGSSGSVQDLLVPGRVTASSDVPQGAMTVPIEPWMLAGRIDVQQISVNVTSFGTIDLDDKSKGAWTQNAHWIRAVRLAEDCHSYNIQLRLQPSQRINPSIKNNPIPKLILQAVRPIDAGQELQLWFSEDILAMLQVVFLSPSHIQGQKKYICTRCSTLYESPNPLKLHITLNCSYFPVSTLWDRLAALMTKTQTVRNSLKKEVFEFKLSPEPQVCRQRNALDLTLPGQDDKKGLYKPYTECSAFKPFKKENQEINGNKPSNNLIVNDIPSIWPITFEADVVQLHRNLMTNHNLATGQLSYNDDAQIESLVSSLGKAKQGHICLYCGKCYSRKYGLKIHIRTHTGYKPLRCKFCERPFGDPSNLNKHVRLHAEGNTPYKCDLCGKILVRRRDLERHLKSRHMVEMHPDTNILPESPSSTKTEEIHSASDEEKDVKVIEIEKKENEATVAINQTHPSITLEDS